MSEGRGQRMRPKIRRHLGLLFEEAQPEKLLVDAAARRPRCPVPVEFTPHRYAVFLLHVAAEIEHALMVQYLYAAFSLGGPKVPTDRWIEVSQWREIILGIAKEEMGHLMTVQNLLRCLGGPLNLDREDFPSDSEFYPFQFKLEPLTLKSLAKYVFAESPADWSGAEADQVRAQAQEGVGNAPINHVGSLYKTIVDLLADETLIKDADFRGSTFPYQANWDEWGRGYKAGERGNSTRAAMAGTPDLLLMPVVARTDSLAALRAVADQGEATPTSNDDAPSHFTRFLQIYRDFPKVGSGWSPSRPVPVDPILLGEGQSDEADGDRGGTPITHPESKLWAHLFNIRYEALLTNLLHTFDYPNSVTDVSQTTPRGLLLHSTFGEMYNIRALSELLVQMPLAPGNSELLAGPPFQIPYTLKPAVDAVDRWRTHLDLLQASVALTERLLALPDQRHAAYLRALREADRKLIAMFEQILRRPSGVQPAARQHS